MNKGIFLKILDLNVPNVYWNNYGSQIRPIFHIIIYLIIKLRLFFFKEFKNTLIN